MMKTAPRIIVAAAARAVTRACPILAAILA